MAFNYVVYSAVNGKAERCAGAVALVLSRGQRRLENCLFGPITLKLYRGCMYIYLIIYVLRHTQLAKQAHGYNDNIFCRPT